MDVQTAVDTAKTYVLNLFGEDGLANLRLEEVERDGDFWKITIGFNRPLIEAAIAEAILGRAGSATLGPRTYRVVTLRDSSREVTSVKIREGLS